MVNFMKLKKKYKLLPQIEPSAAQEAEYQGILRKIIQSMQAETEESLKPKFKRAEIFDEDKPVGNLDDLQEKLDKIKRKYTKRFANIAKEYSKTFVEKVSQDVFRKLKLQLVKNTEVRSIRYTLNRKMRALLTSIANQNVSLIKSIPQRHFARIENSVMGSIRNGHGVGKLYEEIHKNFKTTKNQAYLIAYDQTKKAYENITRMRKIDLGLNTAVWRHSAVSKIPRQSHLKADGKVFDIRKGLLIDGKYTHPKEEINCNCYEQTVISGVEL